VRRRTVHIELENFAIDLTVDDVPVSRDVSPARTRMEGASGDSNEVTAATLLCGE
jgi:hypothetical protein